MVPARVNRCCTSCTDAGFTLAQSQRIHWADFIRRERRRRWLLLGWSS